MSISLNTLSQNYNTMQASSFNPDHEYFNMSTVNQYTENNTQPKPLRFNQTKQFNIVGKVSDYYLSIIRWNLQSNLPVLIPDILIKPSPEKYTGLTEYALSLVYESNVQQTVQNTFGIGAMNGLNYNGIYQNGVYGNRNTYNINFVPDSPQSIDYDNFNNGLDTNGSNNGSVYIISNNILKVFDKVSSKLIYTLTPSQNTFFKFITVDKGLGDFYISKTNNTDDTIEYIQYERTGPATWSGGSNIFTSTKKKETIGDITFLNGVLYEFGVEETDPIEVLGVSNINSLGNLGYFVNSDIHQDNQATGGFPQSSLVVYEGAIYCCGEQPNSKTFSTPWPPAQYPAQPFAPAESTQNILNGVIYSNINNLYGMTTGNFVNAFNLSYSPVAQPPSVNKWEVIGQIPTSGSLPVLCVDKQVTSHKLMYLDSTNNLYITQDPVGEIEFLFDGNAISPTANSTIYGINKGKKDGTQSIMVSRNISSGTFGGGTFGISHGVLMKRGNIIYSPVIGPTSSTTVKKYSLVDFSYIEDAFTENGDVTIIANLGIHYASYNVTNNTITIRRFSDDAVIGVNNYFSGLEDDTVACIYNLSNGYYIVYLGSTITVVYIFSALNNFSLTNEIELTEYADTSFELLTDICVSYNNLVNGAVTLYGITDNRDYSVAGNVSSAICQFTFTDNTYQNLNPIKPPQIFGISEAQFNSGLGLQYIEYDQNQDSIITILSNNTGFTDTQVITLFNSSNFSDSTKVVSTDLDISQAQSSTYFKQVIILFNNLSATLRWTPVTSDIPISQFCISKVNDNELYTIRTTDNAIYKSVLNNNALTSTLFDNDKPYSFVSNTLSTGVQNLFFVNDWASAGNPTNSAVLDLVPLPPISPSNLSINNNGSNIYASYPFGAQTKLNELNVNLTSQQSTTFSQLLLNGIIGMDDQNNLLVSNINNSNNSLMAFSQSLQIVYNNDDPLIEFNTSSAIFYPYVKTSSRSEYFLGSDGAFNLVFIPEVVNKNLENSINYPTSKYELYSNPYFYIKYVDTFCRMINNAIIEAFNSINGATWAHLPYFQWDSVEGKIVYNQPTSTPVVPGIQSNVKWFVSVNQPLYNLLNTFRFKHFLQNAGNQSIYPESLSTRYLLDTNILYDGTQQQGGEFITYVQQISSVQTWSPVVSFVFTSTILPIENQITGQPQNLNNIDPSLGDSIIAQSAQNKILTDFITPLTTGVEQSNQIIYYIPQGEYRLVDLIGNTSLQMLSLEVYWKDKLSTLHPLTLDAGSSSDLLCMLRRKTYSY